MWHCPGHDDMEEAKYLESKYFFKKTNKINTLLKKKIQLFKIITNSFSAADDDVLNFFHEQ